MTARATGMKTGPTGVLDLQLPLIEKELRRSRSSSAACLRREDRLVAALPRAVVSAAPARAIAWSTPLRAILGHAFGSVGPGERGIGPPGKSSGEGRAKQSICLSLKDFRVARRPPKIADPLHGVASRLDSTSCGSADFADPMSWSALSRELSGNS